MTAEFGFGAGGMFCETCQQYTNSFDTYLLDYVRSRLLCEKCDVCGGYQAVQDNLEYLKSQLADEKWGWNEETRRYDDISSRSCQNALNLLSRD